MGTESSKGTKVFALAGKIKRGGLVEVPMGITLREVIFDIGGGIVGDRAFKAVQMGGPSGGCIPASLLDTPVDYDSLTATGAIMGSGGMVVMDETTCMVDVARYFLSFTQSGVVRQVHLLPHGHQAHAGDPHPHLRGRRDRCRTSRSCRSLAANIRVASLCGLGQTAPNPVLTTLRYFRHEYEEHILDKHCRAKAARR